MNKRWLSIAIMACLLLLSGFNLFGQVTATASLQGTIVDKTQAVIGNKAEVTLINKETGQPHYQNQRRRRIQV
jgi:hypothetical protein